MSALVPPSSSPIQIIYQKGIQYGDYLGMASTALIIYDYLISMSDEVSFFWVGPVSLSKVLYLIIYVHSGDLQWAGTKYHHVRHRILLYYLMTPDVLYGAIPLAFVAEILLIVMCQAVISLRVWYLFKNDRVTRNLAAIAYIGCTAGNAVILALLSPGIMYEAAGLTIKDQVMAPSKMYRLFFPSLVLHAVMLILTLWKMKTIAVLDSSSIKRIVQEHNPANAIYLSRYYMDTVITCRTMINFRSLADTLDIDPSWLLNYTELSRVRWHQERRGELVVEATPI
ncbi:hypothetical protein CONPUDRAFT_75685 [Coniophora puteana RWD-64-598 SS2]|uniref:DUF6533 domain-containing protein n=1 Tax=Coniophora puteana (strain RWD-64-598) TaxID=741705 RepID=A0A5M3MG77_CONPW|nr:uncharacterized protein CONPUDRAFT_75685 [Coniophora puteana RWD-64-598 SS2]EIW77930.1 hypothetical protein CONPUDRAFT_75685 [Coniophora puteana RWD-64-598 SS2]